MTKIMTKVKTYVSLQIPPRHRCRWLQEVLGLSDPEMQLALNIHSYTTLRRWRNDAADREVAELKRFDLLLELVQSAKRSMNVRELREWMRTQNQGLGGMVPCKVVGDLHCLGLVLGVLRVKKGG